MIILVLSVHLIAVNLASAGPLFSIWLGRRGVGSDPVWDTAGQKLAWLSFWGLLLGILFGGGQLLLAPSEAYLAALARLPSRALWFAGAELVFSLVCLLLYAGCWTALRKHRWCHASLALLSSSNLLYHFPPLMSVLGKLANDPTWAKTQILDRAALLPLMKSSEVLALTTHFCLASLVVAAMAVLWFSSQSIEETWEKSALPMSRRAAWLALLVTALQLPIGIWLLLSLPHSARTSMMGENAVASLSFVVALLLTFFLLQRLLTIAIGKVEPRDLRQTCWLLAALVLLMTASLVESRTERKPRSHAHANRKTAVGHEAPRLLGLYDLPSNNSAHTK